MPPDPTDLEPELDRLFRLRPPEFVAARNALAKRLRSAGDRDGAARVAALARPSAPAWAVNQLHWESPELWSALVRAGRRVRRAQVETGGAPLAEVLAVRREAVAAARRDAVRRLAESGAALTAVLERRLGATLEALASGAGADVTPGRLTRELEAPGFDVLLSDSGFLARRGETGATAGAGAGEEPTATLEAEEAVSRARGELAASVRREEATAAEHEAAGTRAEAAAGHVADAERQLERSRFRAREAEGRLERARRALEAARAGRGEAEATLAAARRRLEAARGEAEEHD
jgi:hypothetical protein